MQSLLSRAKPGDVKLEPFPHVVIEDALDHELAARLRDEYPLRLMVEDVARDESNRRYNLRGFEAFERPEVTPLWKDFLRYHGSRAFYNEFIELFRGPLAAQYPGREFDDLTVGIRKKRVARGEFDVQMDAQICINSPTSQPTSVRKAHIDEPGKLYAGLFYLRNEADDSEGGEFLVYRPKGNKFRLYNRVYVDDRDCEVHSVVPYRHNVFVLFLNTPRSWHGVSVRSVTRHPRIFANFVGELNEELFDVRSHQRKFDKLLRKLHLRKYDRAGYVS